MPYLVCTLRVPDTSIDAYKAATGWKIFDPNKTVAIRGEITFDKQDIYVFAGGSSIMISFKFNGDIVTNTGAIAWKSSNPEIASVDYMGNVTLYKAGTVVITASFGSIEASCTLILSDAIGGNIDPIRWYIHDETLHVEGEGAIPDYAASTLAPWVAYQNSFSSVVIGEGITKIGECAFLDCYNVSSVTIPNTVITIGSSAFFYCKGLKSFQIPSSVQLIVGNVWRGCLDLTTISVDKDNQAYCSDNGVLFSKDKTEIVAVPNGKSGEYTIPATVHTIGWCAFDNCKSLNSIIIPASVQNIKTVAFYACTGLSQIVNLSTTPQPILTSATLDLIPFNTCTLRVPDVDSYRDAEGWKMFDNIVAIQAEITLSEKAIHLLPGASGVLTATVTGDVTNPDLIVWSSCDPSIATVDNNGKVTGVSKGFAVITAVIGVIEATCIVNVIEVEAGTSTIEGVIDYAGTEDVTLYLYMYVGGDDPSQTKKGLIGGYVLLKNTTPQSNGQYSFGNLPEGSFIIVVVIGDQTSKPSELTISDGVVNSGYNFTVNNDGTVTPKFTTDIKVLPNISVKTYPNPFVDILNIEGADGCVLRIYTVDGKQVHTQAVNNTQETLHLEHLPSGLYIIYLEKGQNAAVSIRAIKK